ncbi:MAG: glycosyltransferase family 2 protein [Flavobacteriales bacterium]|nr:glycosyltransferase family 2 protein [Flavobacteriales bacterium]
MRVAVVILNWNGKAFLQQFLTNVVENSRDHGLVYVADNGSTDGSVAYVQAHHPDVRIIETGGNFGYAGGYNRALEHIAEPYAVLLNSDVEVSPGWLIPLVERMDSDSSIAACQPKLLDFNDRGRFEYAGASGGFIDHWGYPFCRGRLFDTLEPDHGQYDEACPVFWATGACMFVRMSAFRQVGGLDADFFAHMEEIDLCWRLQRMGFSIWAEPRSVVYHVGGGTLHRSSPRKTFLNFRNGLELLLKNLPARSVLPVLFVRMTLDGVAAIRFLMSGQAGDFKAVFNAHFAFYGRLLNTWRKRGGAYPTLPGVYSHSVVRQYYLRGRKRFSDLDPASF